MYGMSSALDRFDRASARVAQSPSGDLARDRVDQVTAERTFEANLSTVRTTDDLVGVLLDITA